MSLPIRWRLSAMMALVYAVQGAFWPLLAVHMNDLGVGGRERGWVFATLAIGSIAMPLGAGRLVDRRFAGQRVISAIYAAASALLVTLAAGVWTGPGSLFAVFLLFWLVTAPAFSLANTVALRHLPCPGEQFAGVRLWGTFGWMAVGWLVALVMGWSGSAWGGRGAYEAFWIAAALAAVVAGFSLTLPETPPLDAAGRGGVGGLREAASLARTPGMTCLLVTAFGVALTTPFIYQVVPPYLESRGLPRPWVSAVLTLSQLPEIGALALLPWLSRRLGVKGTLAAGVAAWAARFAGMAVDPPLWAAVACIPLHGLGVACFTVAGQVYADGRAPRDRRAGAQALYTVVTSGVGSFAGCLLAGDLAGRFAGDYPRVFLVPCVIDSALLVYFCAGFRPGTSAGASPGATDAARPVRHDAVRGAVSRVGNLVTESADG